MGLRVTQNMLTQNALRNITMNSLRLNKFRDQLGTGLRLNRPSDDPSAFRRILPLKNYISEIEGFQENALIVRDLLTTGASAVEDAGSLMAEAKRIAIQGANGTLNDADRSTLAASAGQLLNELISLANTKLGDRYLFAGSATSTIPFERLDGPSGTIVTYEGNDSELTIETAPDAQASITSSGREVFMKVARGPTKFTGATGAKPGAGTDSGRGRAELLVEHTGFSGFPAGIGAGSTASTALGSISYTISTGPNTISINGGTAIPFSAASTNLEVPVGATGNSVYLDLSAYTGGAATGTATSEARMSWDAGQSYAPVDFASTNQQIVHAQSGAVLNVDSTGITQTGKDEIEFGGTFDAFNVLIGLRDILQNDAKLAPDEVTSRLTALVGDLDTASDNILEGLRDLGARGSQLDLIRNRMSRLEVTLEDSLSRDEDIDLSETILEMTQRDVSYQASLAVGARVISVSLMDFLR